MISKFASKIAFNKFMVAFKAFSTAKEIPKSLTVR